MSGVTHDRHLTIVNKADFKGRKHRVVNDRRLQHESGLTGVFSIPTTDDTAPDDEWSKVAFALLIMSTAPVTHLTMTDAGGFSHV